MPMASPVPPFRFAWVAILAMVVLLPARAGFAQTAPPADPAAAAVQAAEAAAAAAAATEPAAPEIPPIADVVKDHEKIDGFFPLYKKGESLFLEIAPDKTNKLFLLATSIAGGPQFSGWQWDDMAVKWERLEKNLLMVRPNLHHLAQEGTPLAAVVSRTFTESIVCATPIVGIDGETVLIDLTAVFKQDFSQLAGLVSMLGGAGYQLNPELSKWATTKGFPQNTEISVDAAFVGSGGGGGSGDVADSRGVRMRLHYSLSEIPESGFTSRRADDRVGYFITAIKNYSRGYQERGMFDRLINRWGLEKLDPTLEVSPPKKPIVFYIEKTVPVPYRRYVKEAILEWNKAFEKIGFVDAVVVRQQTEDNEFAQLDPEDVRYNFFRWITSGSPFAMGPSRVNPLTGEILDADIIMDDSYVRVMMQEQDIFSAESARVAMDDEKLERWYQAHPELDPVARSGADRKGMSAERRFSPLTNTKFLDLLRQRGRSLCTFAQGNARQMTFAWAVSWLQDGVPGAKLPQEFIGEFIKETVMHEVGHTLGLRHNFKGSSWKSLDEINAADRPLQTTGSVMDYNPTNWVLKGKPQGHFAATTIGPYDFWAIEYGYRTQAPTPEHGKEAEAPADEAAMLKQILSRVAEKGLGYATDEDTSLLDPDPAANRWDLGDDGIAYARQRAELAGELLKELKTRAVPDGEDYHLAKRAFTALLGERLMSGLMAMRYVGGQSVSRDHKGDPNARAPFQIVPVAKQREALQFVVTNLLAESAFQFDPDLLNHLAPGRWDHWDSDESDVRQDFPIHDVVNRFQGLAFALLLHPWTLKRVHDAELKVPAGEDALTVAEILQGLRSAVWTELSRPAADGSAWTERKPFINSVRRMLQREWLEINTSLALQPAWHNLYPADVSALAWDGLREVAGQLDQTLANAKNLDAYSRAHLRDTRARIEEALKARYSR